MTKTVDTKWGVIPAGTTTFYTMIGTPIIQVKSPLIYNRYFVHQGIDAVMIAMNVPPDQVKNHFEHTRAISNFGGSIVTIPHKQSAVDSMDEMSERAKILMSVNVVRAEKGVSLGTWSMVLVLWWQSRITGCRWAASEPL